jgi:hypothetical protein
VPHGTAEAEDRHSKFYDARVNLGLSPRHSMETSARPLGGAVPTRVDGTKHWYRVLFV